DLEPRALPLGVHVRRALVNAIHRLAEALVGVDRCRELRPDQHHALVPVDVRLDLDAARLGHEAIGLDERRVVPSACDADGNAQRALLDQLDAVDAGDLLADHFVGLVDVPRVPGAGLVHVRPELVAAILQRLAVDALVEDAVEGAVLADLDADERILEDEALAGCLGANRFGKSEGVGRLAGAGDDARLEPAQLLRRVVEEHAFLDRLLVRAADLRAGGQRGQQGPVIHGRVDDGERALAVTIVRLDRLVADAGRRLDDAGQLRDGVLVNLVDRGPGQDVVELVVEQVLPLRVERLDRDLAPAQRRQRGEGLGLDEPVLALPHELLGPRLGGEGCAVQLEVQLADVRRDAFDREAGEEVLDLAHLEAREHREVLDALVLLEHVLAWAASAVAPAEGEQGLVVPALAGEVLPGVVGGDRLNQAVVTAFGIVEGVRQDLAAVDALPHEEVVREGVCLAPGHLDGEEVLDAATEQDLRHGGGEAEDVRQPCRRVTDAEGALEVALAVEELADIGLAAADLAVRLDPHAADRLPAAFLHALLNLLEQLRIVLLDPGVCLRGGLVEDEVVVLLHQPDLRGPGAASLAARLCDRPQPGEVDMGVAGEHDAADRRVLLAQLGDPLRDHLAGTLATGQRFLRERFELAFGRWDVPDAGDDEAALVAGMAVVAQPDAVGVAAGDVAGHETGLGDVGPGGPCRDEFTVGLVDDIEQVRQDRMILELLRRGDGQRQVGLERTHPIMRDGQERPADRRGVDMGAEHTLRHDLGLDPDRLATVGAFDDPVVLVERVQAVLLARGELDEAFTAQPELDLDRLALPFVGNCRLGGESDRAMRIDDRPGVATLELRDLAIGAGERPVLDGCDHGVAPRPELRKPARLSFEPPKVVFMEVFHDGFLSPAVHGWAFLRDVAFRGEGRFETGLRSPFGANVPRIALVVKNGYPLRPATEMPSVNVLWKDRKSTITGRTISVDAAISRLYWTSRAFACWKKVRPMESV